MTQTGISVSEIFARFDFPFQHICQSVKKDLKSGISVENLIRRKQKEIEDILLWFKSVQAWGKPVYEKYNQLYHKTLDEKYSKLRWQSIATMSAPWALSWTQYNIGECFEFVQEYEKALEEYKKSFSLWVKVEGWNGNGASVDAFKRILIILSKLKDKNKFIDFRAWFLEIIQKCPEEIRNHYNRFVLNDLEKREAVLIKKLTKII